MATKKPMVDYGGGLSEINSSDQLTASSLGTGTANSTTYLRGDLTWQTVSGGASVPGASGQVLRSDGTGGMLASTGLTFDGNGTIGVSRFDGERALITLAGAGATYGIQGGGNGMLFSLSGVANYIKMDDSGNWHPMTTTQDLGLAGYKWRTVYAGTVNAYGYVSTINGGGSATYFSSSVTGDGTLNSASGDSGVLWTSGKKYHWNDQSGQDSIMRLSRSEGLVLPNISFTVNAITTGSVNAVGSVTSGTGLYDTSGTLRLGNLFLTYNTGSGETTFSVNNWGSLIKTNLFGDWIPLYDNTQDIGTSSLPWDNGYFRTNLFVNSNAVLTSASSIPISQISATGTRDSTTYLRGDGTWAVPAGGSGGGISGLTTNKVAKATSATTIGDGVMYDDGTNIGIGTTSPSTLFHVVKNSLGAAYSVGAALENTTPAISGTQQWSPGFELRAQGYKTTAPIGSQPVVFRSYVSATQGPSVSGAFVMNAVVNGVNVGTLQYDSTGLLQVSSINCSGTITSSASTVSGINVTATTSARSPILEGGNGATNNLTLKSTSGTGTSDYVRCVVGNNGATEAWRVITSGRMGIGVTAPTANLHVKQGTISASGAGLKLDPGILMTTPESGAIETDGTYLYWTNSSAVRQILNPGKSRAIASKTANYTILDADGVIEADATSGNISITLPTPAASRKGAEFQVIKTDSTANTVTVVGTINGATNYVLSTQYKRVSVKVNTAATAYLVTENN